MAPDEELISRFTDRVKIVVTEAMQTHVKEVHAAAEQTAKELQAQMDNMEKTVAFWKGAIWAFGGLFTLILGLLEWAKH